MPALHFISGLPRSGSTLLAALLRQNPRFSAGMTGPLAVLFRSVEDATAPRQETSVFVTDGQRDALLSGLFAIYYRGCDAEVVFDTSRMWCARLPVLARLFPPAKVIACVRELGWIADSFERLYRRNGQRPSGIYGWETGGTVWSRTAALMSANGVAGYAINAVQEAAAAEEAPGRLRLVDYEQLCRDPEAVLRSLYEFIGEPWYRHHDFERVEYAAGEFDRQLGAAGLHTVTGAVAWRPRQTILPAGLFAQFNGPNFWR
jgi:sulfotransferase